MAAAQVEGLTVRLGARTALDGVDLVAEPGRVLAVAGGDGAGKTTLLRVLVGALAPTGGRVHRPPPERIGYVSPGPGVWRDLTVEETLAFAAAAYGVPRPQRGERIARLLERTRLDGARRRLAGALSGGMRQKLALAAALMPAPELLVLDEPTTGVDPVSRAELWALISGAAADGAAVVLATTYLDEADRAARVLLLDEGRLLVSGTPREVCAAVRGTVAVSDEPGMAGRSWRRGRRWRVWSPPGVEVTGEPVEPDLEDAVIVATLERSGA